MSLLSRLKDQQLPKERPFQDKAGVQEGSGNPRDFLRPLAQNFALSLPLHSIIQAILIAKPRVKGREVHSSHSGAAVWLSM